MKIKDVQGIIARNYPEKMRYTQARPLIVKNKAGRRRIPRLVGASTDKLLSVEINGWKQKVSSIEFMIGLTDTKKAASIMMAVAKTIETAVPSWGNEDTDWLQGVIEQKREDERNHVRVKFMDMPQLSIMFVRIKPERQA